MTEDLTRKRARDLARYHARKNAGIWQRSSPRTPEQQALADARKQRAMQWREVGRAFERLLRLPDAARHEVKRALDDCYDDMEATA